MPTTAMRNVRSASATDRTAASLLAPVVRGLVGEPLPVRLELWDGSTLGPDDGGRAGTLRVHTPNAIRRLLWSPNELGIGRAFVSGEIDADGDLYAIVVSLRGRLPESRGEVLRLVPPIARAARRLGVLGRPPAPPVEEARLRGGRHSVGRDAAAIGHHYDVGNDFYRLVLGPSMTYSCARFVDEQADLDTAQSAKHDLVCRKLGLDEMSGGRLLDVGCGWGSMAIHAATHYDVSVVGITISEAQAALARKRIAEAGVADRVEIRLQDYRHLGTESFDAISSIGMSEHVGQDNLDRYFELLRRALRPTGRLVNHAISSVGGSELRRAFVGRYVFPDGELIDVGDSILAMERAGFEVRDVESLREHYARTLRAWVANLETAWDDAVAMVGEARARIWRLYMTGSAIGFMDNGIAVHQVLGVVPDRHGASAMPPTRRSFEGPIP